MCQQPKYPDLQAFNDLIKCTVCPRTCKVDRTKGPIGYCKTDAGFNISSICIHRGEEPVISGKDGICNVFFGHCNLQCIYCQNYQISQNGTTLSNFGTLDQITEEIITCLDKGCKSVGFVSPSHMVPQMVMIINSLHRWERYPTIVYNSNGYDKVETLQKLEGLVDVYLPDLKYSENNLGKLYSDVKDYWTVASLSVKEMYRQMGSRVIIDDSGNAVRGLIIRHLVLPGEVHNSIEVLRFIESELSSRVYISLMAQYHPAARALENQRLNRTLKKQEYALVINELENLGFSDGWIQELESHSNYLPDFSSDHPFEKTA